jgi:methionine-gamma-lyase
LAKRQMLKFGGMVSFDIAGGLDAGRRLMDHIKVFTLAVSLGCVDSLIQHPASMTHACVPREKREKGGVTDGLIRISVGIEDVDDLVRLLTKEGQRRFDQIDIGRQSEIASARPGASSNE